MLTPSIATVRLSKEGNRAAMTLSVSASGSAADRDRRRKPKVGEHGAGDQVQGDVEASEGKNAEQVANENSQQPNDEQDHTDHLAEGPRVGHTAGGGKTREADRQVHQVVEQINVREPQQGVLVLRDRDEAACPYQRADKAEHAGEKIDDSEDQGDGLDDRSIPHCITPELSWSHGTSAIDGITPSPEVRGRRARSGWPPLRAAQAG